MRIGKHDLYVNAIFRALAFLFLVFYVSSYAKFVTAFLINTLYSHTRNNYIAF